MNVIIQFILYSLLFTLAVGPTLGRPPANLSLYPDQTDSATGEGDRNIELNLNELEVIVAHNVRNFLILMKDLEEYQIEPMRLELQPFFSELALISQANKLARATEKHPRKTLDKLLKETAKLRAQTRKRVKAILDKKQLRHYNNLVDKIAPLPVRDMKIPLNDGAF